MTLDNLALEKMSYSNLKECYNCLRIWPQIKHPFKCKHADKRESYLSYKDPQDSKEGT